MRTGYLGDGFVRVLRALSFISISCAGAWQHVSEEASRFFYALGRR